jgi:uncharacterized protein
MLPTIIVGFSQNKTLNFRFVPATKAGRRLKMNAGSPKQFSDRVVMVTGASSGFGLATARAFASRGARLVLTARNPARLQQAVDGLRQQNAPPLIAQTCDVSRRGDVDGLVARALQEFSRIDILVNNAGSGLIAPFEKIQIEDARALFETNFFGAFNCTQAVLPTMIRQRAGHIVNLASVAGLRGIPNSSMYCASKAALIAFSDSLRLEVKRHNIAVTTICPSRTNDTPFVERAKKYSPIELYKVPDTLTTDMVVRALLDAVTKRKRMVILPFHARLMNTANKFAPRLVDNYLYQHMPKPAEPASVPQQP